MGVQSPTLLAMHLKGAKNFAKILKLFLGVGGYKSSFELFYKFYPCAEDFYAGQWVS